MTRTITKSTRKIRRMSCPTCEALPGEGCVNLTRLPYRYPVNDHHTERVRAAGVIPRSDKRAKSRVRGRPLSEASKRTKAVVCPACGAGVGVNCVSMKTGARVDFHVSRRSLANLPRRSRS